MVVTAGRATVARSRATSRAKVVRYRMREHSSLPPEQPEPAAAAASGTAGPRAPADLHPGGSANGEGSPDFSLPESAALADETPAARWRQRLPWILLLFVVLAVGGAAPALVRKWQADQALHELARVAALPAAPAAGAPPDVPAAGTATAPTARPDSALRAPGTPPIAAAPTTPPLPAAAAGGAGDALTGDPPTGRSAGLPGAAAEEGATTENAIGSGPLVPSELRHGGSSVAIDVGAGAAADSGDVTRPEGASGAARAAEPEPRENSRAAQLARRNAAPERRTVAKNTTRNVSRNAARKVPGKAAKRSAQASGTFRRCPPLGTEGAVICRWHICNGGAGKEPACRPYLERRP